MKKFLLPFTLILFVACNNGSDSKSSTDSSAASNTASSASSEEDLAAPYTAVYSTKYEIGKPEYAKTIMQLWKAYDNRNVSTVKDLLADSVQFYLADGTQIIATRDSAIAAMNAFLKSVDTVKSDVFSVVSLRSTDKNENWVCVWGADRSVDKKGKATTRNLQETWMLDDNGKAKLVYQFASNIKTK